MQNADLPVEQARKQSQTETTPPEVLSQLSLHGDRSIRQNVAANPNTPAGTLLSLSIEFPEVVFNNPVFLLILLENPRFFSCKYQDSRRRGLMKLRYLVVQELSRLNWTLEDAKRYLKLKYGHSSSSS